MPDTLNYSITTPCATDGVTLDSLQLFATEVDAAITVVQADATKALVRPSAWVRSSVGVAYTAGVALIPSYDTIVYNNNAMFSLAAPTVFTVNVVGVYLISFQSSSNMASTNTSHKAEILINGVPVSFVESGPGTAVVGVSPSNPIVTSSLNLLSVGNTISSRVTVAGVGNSTTFPRFSATLVSYGGS